ncbi:rrg1 [Candida margitis]|uniref:rrg1 n=1 Tax=Candida margitis TaxID=1775924 RepID=UPI0022274DF3|nr:rrg1 [Candida margitis]KAI5954105.1 rrg1 [Candida margitis]
MRPKMEFDPLAFFTPSLKEDSVFIQDDSLSVKAHVQIAIHQSVTSERVTSWHDDSCDECEEEEDALMPLHILDLPMLRLQPPYPVLVTILKLLSPDEVLNFEPSNRQQNANPDEEAIFREKAISSIHLKNALTWLNNSCPRLNASAKLSLVPHLSLALRANFTNEYNAYMTRIVSNELSWMSEAEKEEVQSLASMRISENCGRMAQPQLKRKIHLANLEKYGREYIYLNEPSMTNDNLGLKTWGSSLILGSRLLRVSTGSPFLKEPVLELGSGTGLVGMCCCLMGMVTTLTDLPQIVPNLQTNLKLNNLENYSCAELDWSAPGSSPVYGKSFSTVVVSDPVYSSQHPHWVVNMISLFLNDDINNNSVLIEVPLRPSFENERQLLWKLMSDQFVEVESEIEDGYDDFGEMKFCYKRFIRKI